jgi:hypothetical protein
MIELLIVLIILGLVLYVINLLPIDATIKKIIVAVAVVFVVIWVIEIFLGGAGFAVPWFPVRR